MSESWSWCSSWKTAPPARTIPLQMFQCFNTTNQSFAVGSVFFFPHLKVETKQVNNHDRSLATPIPETTILPNDNEYTENDNEMTDSSKRIIDEQVTADTYLWIALASTPLAYQIQQKDYGSKRSHKADTLSKVWKIAAETRTKICRICSKYQGDRSRKLQAENSGLFIAPKQNQKKN